jgi:hypothetical protein
MIGPGLGLKTAWSGKDSIQPFGWKATTETLRLWVFRRRRLRMKKVIELLRKANESLCRVASWMRVLDSIATATDYINEALVELKALDHWYTPEQWKQRTGEEWPDGAAVYGRVKFSAFEIWSGWTIKSRRDAVWEYDAFQEFQIVCATKPGPPPDDWKPEEAQ